MKEGREKERRGDERGGKESRGMERRAEESSGVDRMGDITADEREREKD